MEYQEVKDSSRIIQPVERLLLDGQDLLSITDTTEVQFDDSVDQALAITDPGEDDALDSITDEAPDEANDVVEGEIVDGSEVFDYEIADEPLIHVLGGDQEARDRITYEIVRTQIEDLKDKPEAALVLSIDFGANAEPPLLVSMADSEGYNAGVSKILDDKGVLSTLSNDQISEVLGEVAASREPGRYNQDAFADILGSTGAALEQTLGRNPTLQERVDGVRVLDGARSGRNFKEAPSLSKEQRTAVEQSIGLTRQQLDREAAHLLRQHLDRLLPMETGKSDQTHSENDPSEPSVEGINPTEGVNVVHVGVEGYGTKLAMQQNVLSAAALPLIVENTEWGRPEVVVVRNADKADGRMHELLDHCENQGIQVVLDGGLDKAVRPGAFALAKLSPVEASVLTQFVGPIDKVEEVVSASQGVHANIGGSISRGASLNYRDPDSADGGGKSSSRDMSVGRSFDYSESSTIGEAPRFRPSDLGSIGVGEVVIIDSAGQSIGIFDVDSRLKIGDFPKNAKPALNVRGNIDEIHQQTPEVADIPVVAQSPEAITANDVAEALKSSPQFDTPQQARVNLNNTIRQKKGSDAVKGRNLIANLGNTWITEYKSTGVSLGNWAESNGISKGEVKHIARMIRNELNINPPM